MQNDLSLLIPQRRSKIFEYVPLLNQVLLHILGKHFVDHKNSVDYLDRCDMKINIIDYDLNKVE